MIYCLYTCRIKRSEPYPDLQSISENDCLDLEETQRIYGTIDIDRIKHKLYTESKHEAFMSRFGVLIQD
jgi:hypothetical protein